LIRYADITVFLISPPPLPPLFATTHYFQMSRY
jgi:hypothetical protein